jgi:hypothetical protein
VSLPLFLQGLGSVGVFASRAFLPAFVTALLLRFGPQVPWLAHAGLIPHVTDVPTWFTSNTALVVLGALAALELLAERSPEASTFLAEVHDYLKAVMAVVTYLGVLNATDRAVADQVIHQAGMGGALPALAVGAGVLLATRARGAVLGLLTEADEDDDLGLQRFIRWAEDLWGGLGPVGLIVFPLLALAAFGLALLVLVWAERRLEARAERGNAPCARCGQPIHASAPACPSCRAPVDRPRDVGLLGRPKGRPADPSRLPYQLVAVKRCPVCATRLAGRSVRQTCGACGHQLMEDPRFARDYIAAIDRRVPGVLLVCLLLGLVPVLGVLPGVVYYRLALVAPYRRYIPPVRGFLLRWGVRLAVLLLVAFQWVPVAGAFALPAIALLNYAVYRSGYRSLALAP